MHTKTIKHKLMKKLFTFNLKSLLLMCLMTLGLTASAEEVTFTFKTDKDITYVSEGTSGGGSECEVNKSGITITGTNAYTASTKSLTVYAKSTMTITAPGKISKVDLVYNGKVYPFDEAVGSGKKGEKFSTSGSNPASFTPATPAESITFSNPNGGKSELLSVKVTYTAESGGSTPVKTLSSIAVTTQPTKTEYTVGDALDLTGCVVTATYSDNTTANVTSSCTFSPANGAKLETAGTQKVSVSYEGKTASFDVTVKAASAPVEGGEEYALTSLSEIGRADDVIITMTNSSGTYAMSNNKGTGSAPSAVAVAVSDNKVTTDETTILWNVAYNSTDQTFVVYPKGTSKTWLYCTNTNNGVRVGTGTAKTFQIKDGYLYEDGTSDPRFIGVYNSADFRCYNSINSNISGQTLAFYVKKNADVPVIETVATPTFTPAAGTYTEAQSVTISCATEGAAIYYTTDGKTPTTSSTAYTAAITVDKSMTIKAIAVKEGMEDSEVASAKYVINLPVVLAGSGEGTAASPYDVTRALDYIAKNQDATVEVYVEGIISNIKSIDVTKYERAQYYISNDGSETDQLYIFNGYYLNGEKFTANDQIKVGDKVVVCGKLMDYNGTKEMDANNKIVNIESSTSGKITPVLKFAPASVTATLGEEFVAPVLTNESNVDVSYSSSKEEVATVDASTGAVTLVGAGTTTITAKFAGNDTYNAVQASYTLVVEESKPVVETVERAIVTTYNGTWYAATPELSSKKLVAVEVVVMDGKVYYAGDKTIAWAYAEADGTFATADGKYLAQSGTGTDVTISATGNIKWSFETKGMVNANTKDRVLIYRSGSGFGNYGGTNAGKSGYATKSEILPIATAEELAAAMAEAANVEITSAGYATYCPMFTNVAIPANVEVYSVQSGPKNDVVALTKYEGTTLKQGEGVILVGDASIYTFATTADDATAIDGNLLKGATSDTELAENTAYILANGAEGVGFYINEAGTIKAGKAYLPASGSAAPVLKFVIDDANAIQSATEAEGYKLKANGAYNLAGQKVASDYKGIVIMNGKKFLKK